MPTDLIPSDENLTDADLKSIENKINDGIEQHSYETLKDGPRKHLGISGIGAACSRQIYYNFRWMKQEDFNGRMLRLFKRGHREESRYINLLEGIGFKVFQHDPDTGKQFRMSGVMGHYGGSCDGVGISPWVANRFLLEFKTHNTKSFVNYINKGLHKAKPQHIDQMNGYGFKLDLKYGIYFPENKNDDDIQVTVVKLDPLRGMQLERKAQEIILAVEPPPKISENPSFFDCSYCVHKGHCHGTEQPDKNCRSCRLSKPVEDGMWFCSRYNSNIPDEYIAAGCPGWTPI